MRFNITALLIALILASLVHADPVAQPPNRIWQWVFTVAGTPVAAGADTVIQMDAAVGGRTSAILIKNDNAAGGADIWFTVDGSAATAPADGTTGSNIITVKGAETLTYDGTWNRIRLRSSSGNSAARVQASFTK